MSVVVAGLVTREAVMVSGEATEPTNSINRSDAE
jgi:hypothetical protein